MEFSRKWCRFMLNAVSIKDHWQDMNNHRELVDFLILFNDNNALFLSEIMVYFLRSGMKSFWLHIVIFLLVFCSDRLAFIPPPGLGECTIGVFSGSATVDGRPMLWKNRDVTDAVQKFCYFQPPRDADRPAYGFLGNVYSSDTNSVYMGVNEVGFAIINSNSYNLGDSLPDGINDGDLMRMALERCQTLQDFEALLDLTAEKGRKDCWNIGAFDARGNAALYECSNYEYVKFDANDPEDATNGVILRATFGLSGGPNKVGIERYKRVNHLVHERVNEEPLDAEFILQVLSRDLANPIADPYPLPYTGMQNGRPEGFILTQMVTINRFLSRSCMVIRGTKPGEDPSLSTSFCTIGAPVVSVAFPLWVRARQVPPVLNMGLEVPMYTLTNRHRAHLYPSPKANVYINSLYLVNLDGGGFYSYTLPLERQAIEIAEEFVNEWNIVRPSPEEVEDAQMILARLVYETYLEIPIGYDDRFLPEIETQPEIASYPNPFNAQATIHINGFNDDEPIHINIYDLLGRQVRSLQAVGVGEDFAVWDGTDNYGRPLASGIYLIRAETSRNSAVTKSLLMK